MSWFAIGWAGFVATTLCAAFFWMVRSLGWSRFSPPVQLGCLVRRDPGSPTTETLGMLAFFVLGSSIVPAGYAWALALLGDAGLATGLALGAAHGLVTAAALPLLGTISACIRAGRLEPPGRFGVQWGAATPAAVVVGHAVYGAVVGVTLAAF